jgi:predicted DNA-binding ribbon-helix-helix protein
LEKRSLTLAGHRTSVSLEPAFWAALEEIAGNRRLSVSALIGQIDEARGTDNLASALRLAVLAWYRDRR